MTKWLPKVLIHQLVTGSGLLVTFMSYWGPSVWLDSSHWSSKKKTNKINQQMNPLAMMVSQNKWCTSLWRHLLLLFIFYFYKLWLFCHIWDHNSLALCPVCFENDMNLVLQSTCDFYPIILRKGWTHWP